jgi:flavodoxin I
MKTAVAYGSSTGKAKRAAEAIQAILGGDLVDVAAAGAADALQAADVLVLGTSTWGAGDLQDDWAAFLPTLEAMDLSGKTVALFGLGDQAGWGDTFVDGMGILYETVVRLGALKVVGTTSRAGYDFVQSRALMGDQFVGLALDEENQSEKTQERIANWAAGVKNALAGK